jgi:nucleosome binding factor SPN SPT16 subunit
MKTVNEDPFAFYEEGGWEFLTGGDDVSFPRIMYYSKVI